MEYKELGRTGEMLPVLGLGTWKLGVDTKEEIATLREGFRLGMRFVDTAEMYHTEWIVGKALKGEKSVFVATKVTPDNFHYNDVIASCNQSLKELGVKQIDLYQLHWPNKRIPIGETMKAMEELVEKGKVRYIGVSNFSLEEMKEAQSAMKRNDIVANQVEYSVLVRDVEKEVLDFCKKERITVIAYSPFAMGKMFSAKNAALLELLAGIGRKHGKSVAQVALSWLISKENVITIPKASSREHVIENAGAVDFKLSASETEKISSFL